MYERIVGVQYVWGILSHMESELSLKCERTENKIILEQNKTNRNNSRRGEFEIKMVWKKQFEYEERRPDR